MQNFLRLWDTPASLPFRFTMKHYHVFSSGVVKTRFKEEKLDSPESWDMLRTTDPLFTIADTRDEWIEVSTQAVRKDGQDVHLAKRAREIAEILWAKNISTVFSTGSGGAGLEYLLYSVFPELKILCSEYAPATVSALKKVFLEAEDIILFDIKESNWNVVTERMDAKNTLCLMYRLDAQFTDNEWKEIFTRLAGAGVVQVLFIPTGFLTMKGLLSRLRSRITWFLKRRPMVFSGYLRTKETMHTYWERNFQSTEYVVGGMTSFWLTLKK